MATAKRIDRDFYPRDVQLTLTAYEATVLRFVCARIGGTPGETPRGAMDRIASALSLVNVDEGDFQTLENNRSIHLKDSK